MNVLKEKRKEAAERLNVMAAKKYEEEYKEYKAASKKEKKIVEACTKEFEKLMPVLEELDEKLNQLGVEFKSFVELCKSFFCHITLFLMLVLKSRILIYKVSVKWIILLPILFVGH